MSEINHLHPQHRPAELSTYTLSAVQQGPACCVPESIISIRGLSVRYHEKPAIEEVSIDISKGCITALIGPSGCGKTTFLSTINRMTDLQTGVRVSGEIRFDGVDIHAPQVDVRALRSTIGMIFQKPNPFPLSIRRNLELPLREHGVTDKAELAKRVETSLRDVGLWDEVVDRLNSPALKLSGGQQQRLCIARALVLAQRCY